MRTFVNVPVVGCFSYLASSTFATVNDNHRYEQRTISCIVEEIISQNENVSNETESSTFQCILNTNDKSGMNRITADLIIDENERDLFRTKP